MSITNKSLQKKFNKYFLFSLGILLIAVTACNNEDRANVDLRKLENKGTRVAWDKALEGFVESHFYDGGLNLKIFNSTSIDTIQLSNEIKNSENCYYTLARKYLKNNALYVIQSERLNPDNWKSYLLRISGEKEFKILDTVIIKKKFEHENAICGNLSKSGERLIIGIEYEKISEVNRRLRNSNMCAPINKVQLQNIDGSILFEKILTGFIQISENSWNTAEDMIVFNTYYRDDNSIFLIFIKKITATYITDGKFPQWYSDNQILFVLDDKIYLYDMETQKKLLLFQCENRLLDMEYIHQMILLQDAKTIYFQEHICSKFLPNILFKNNYYTLKF